LLRIPGSLFLLDINAYKPAGKAVRMEFFTQGKGRLVGRHDIPKQLWSSASSIIHLPPMLVASWRDLLQKRGLLDRAKQPAPENLVGGLTEKESKDHLVWRFTGSSARVSMLMLDPKGKLENISDAFYRTFSGNRVFIADIPAGAGAAILTVLTTLAELRKQERIPRNPLTVVILAGELSQFSRGYANSMLEKVKKDLADQAISIEFHLRPWDALDKFSTSDLVRNMTLFSQDAAARMVVLANFSGFLNSSTNWKKAQAQFEEIFRHSTDEIYSTAIWIEPGKKNVTNETGFFRRVTKWFKDNLQGSLRTEKSQEEMSFARSEAQVKHPLKDHEFRSNLTVLRFDLPSVGAAE
jgi:hypothetical protein